MRTVPSIVAILALSLAALCAQAQQSYTVTPLQSFMGGSASQPEDLNNRGTVVGSTGAERHAFLWRDGRFVDLQPRIAADAVESEALGINDRAEIAGFYTDAQFIFRGYLLRDNRVTPLHILADDANVIAVDVNNRSQVIGLAFDESGRGGQFVWSAGTAVFLHDLAGGGQVSLREINDHGVVVGTDSSNGRRAALWRRDGTPLEVGGLPGAVSSEGRGINEHGVVLGNSEFAAAPQPLSRAFTWVRGRFAELSPLPEHTNSFGLSINNHGVVVGASATLGPRTAALWQRDGLVVNLNQRVAANDPLKPFLTLLDARLINDRGEILVSATDSRAPFFTGIYLLRPVH